VYGLALRILGDPSAAKDITLEVYLQVWRTEGNYDPERGPVLPWLVTIVRSRAIDCWALERLAGPNWKTVSTRWPDFTIPVQTRS